MAGMANTEYREIAQQAMGDAENEELIARIQERGELTRKEFEQLTTHMTPLETEDGSDGYWDATRMGNGRGTSFVDIGGETYQVVEEMNPDNRPEERMANGKDPDGGLSGEEDVSSPASARAAKVASKRSEAYNDPNNPEFTGNDTAFDAQSMSMAQDAIGEESIVNLQPDEIMRVLLRGKPSPEAREYYNQLSPDDKLRMLDDIINSDGLGNIDNLMVSQ